MGKIKIPKKLLSVQKAAEIMDCSEKTVRRLCTDGHLVACKIRGCLRIEPEYLAKFINQQIEYYMEKNGVPEIFWTEVD